VPLFSAVEFIMTKSGWASFWANFSQTHLVTLPGVRLVCLPFYLLAQKKLSDKKKL
jgi:hypothetical protein